MRLTYSLTIPMIRNKRPNKRSCKEIREPNPGKGTPFRTQSIERIPMDKIERKESKIPNTVINRSGR
jgi:hypothetical protein